MNIDGGIEASFAFMDVGDPVTLAAVVVAVSLLIVILLFLPYFTILKAISDHSYPNAVFKAVGLPFLSKHLLEMLSESGNETELASRLGEYGIRMPQNRKLDLEEIEDVLETEAIRMLRNTLASVPDGTKPFFRAYIGKMDALQVKKALRGLRSGLAPRIHPVYYIDAEVARRLSEAKTQKEVVEALDGTPLGPVLSDNIQQNPERPVLWEMSLDQRAMDELSDSVFHVDSDLQAPLREFYGRLADVENINLLARATAANISSEEVLSMMSQGGRELPRWMLERLADSPDLQALLAELESVSYGVWLREHVAVVSAEPADVEMALERCLLHQIYEISSKNGLLAGPSVLFAFGKEKEMANIRVLARSVRDGVPFGDIEPFLVLEVSA